MKQNLSESSLPIRWSVAGVFETTIQIKATLSPEYHLYSVTQPPGGPIATTFRLSGDSPLFSIAGIKPSVEPICQFDHKFGMETEYHLGEVVFELTLRPEKPIQPGSYEVPLEIKYQLCDENLCLRPEKLGLPVEVEVTEASLNKLPTTETENQATQELSSDERLNKLFEQELSREQIEAGVREILADDPKWEKGYLYLAFDPVMQGNTRRAKSILRQGIAICGDSPNLHFSIADTENTVSGLRSKMLDYAKRFPEKREIAFLALARGAKNQAERVKFQASGGTVVPMNLARDEPEKALALVESQVQRFSDFPEPVRDSFVQYHQQKFGFYQLVCELSNLLQAKKHKEALAAAEKLEPPTYEFMAVSDEEKRLVVWFKAKTYLAANLDEKAFNLLLADSATLMDESLFELALEIGKRLGKPGRTVEKELWERILSKDQAPAEFEIPRHNGQVIKTADYRGEVTLINVWNPG